MTSVRSRGNEVRSAVRSAADPAALEPAVGLRGEENKGARG